MHEEIHQSGNDYTHQSHKKYGTEFGKVGVCGIANNSHHPKHSGSYHESLENGCCGICHENEAKAHSHQDGIYNVK